MDKEPKRATWLELFYDVAYVALIAQLTYLATEYHHTPIDLVNIILIGYAIFVVWWGTTANRNLQPGETDSDKLFIQLQMIGAFIMSIFMGGVFTGDYLPFFLTLGGVRLLQSMMMARMYYQHPETRPVTYNILQGFIVAGLLWLTSAIVPQPLHFIVAFAALFVDILVPLTVGKGNTTRYLNVYHLQERLGLFLMLVIGESMIVVALASTISEDFFASPTVVFSGLGLMVALWWLYFDHSDRHNGTRPRNLFVFIHSHGLLYLSIILISVAYKLILENIETDKSLALLLSGGLGLMLTLSSIRYALHDINRSTATKILAFAVVAFTACIYGLFNNLIYETVVLMTGWFVVLAIIDYSQFLGKKR
jgi:low temperature requirement protein LtrA